MNPTDEDVLAALPVDGSPIGIRALADVLDLSVRRLGSQVERLVREGRLHVDRPAGGVSSGERQIRRDGDTVDSLRAQLAASQARAAAIHAAALHAYVILSAALGGAA